MSLYREMSLNRVSLYRETPVYTLGVNKFHKMSNINMPAPYIFDMGQDKHFLLKKFSRGRPLPLLRIKNVFGYVVKLQILTNKF